MIQRILVPLDGSDLAERALSYAQTFAPSSAVRLVVVVPPSAGRTSKTRWAGQEGMRLAAEYLDLLAKSGRLGPMADRRVRVGDPTRAILEAIQDEGADLVVMSTHGRSGLGRWLYGSVADGVMRGSTVPVIILPPDARTAAMIPGPDVLVPLDGSDQALRAIGPAEALAELLDARILLLQVVVPELVSATSVEAWNPIDPLVRQAASEAYLGRLAAYLRSRGRAVEATVSFGLPVATICERAREPNVGLIAMSSRGKGGATRMLLGSVASGVVRFAERPVLVVGPRVAVALPDLAGSASSPEITRPEAPAASGGAASPITPSGSTPEAVPEAVGGAGAAAALVGLLRAGPDRIRSDLSRALVGLGVDAAPTLLPLLGDSDDAVRARAADALARIADPRTATALVASLEDPDSGVRWNAGRGLAHMGESGLAAVLRALATRPLSPWLAQGATRVLRHYAAPGPKPAGLRRLAEALTHPTAAVEAPVRAAEALTELEAGQSGGS